MTKWMWRFSFLIVGACIFLGCNREKLPEGMPKLYPCTITIIQDGKPLSEASITLHPEDSTLLRWIPGGVTDRNGVCTVRTLGRYPGSMSGSFKVTVEKIEAEESSFPGDPPPGVDKGEWDRKREQEKLRAWRLVEKKYSSYLTTPLEMQVSAGKNSEKFDIGASVRDEIPTLN